MRSTSETPRREDFIQQQERALFTRSPLALTEEDTTLLRHMSQQELAERREYNKLGYEITKQKVLSKAEAACDPVSVIIKSLKTAEKRSDSALSIEKAKLNQVTS